MSESVYGEKKNAPNQSKSSVIREKNNSIPLSQKNGNSNATTSIKPSTPPIGDVPVSTSNEPSLLGSMSDISKIGELTKHLNKPENSIPFGSCQEEVNGSEVTSQITQQILEMQKVAQSGGKSSIFGTIFLIFLLICLIGALNVARKGYSFVSNNREKIQKNWKHYRCDARVAPFAGWLIGPKSVSTVENMVECTSGWFWAYIYNFMEPIFDLLGVHTKHLFELGTAVQHIRQSINNRREQLESSLGDVGMMLMKAYQNIAAVFKAMWKEISYLFKAFEDGFYALAYGIYTMASVWNSPVGGVGRFFCFRPSTPIQLQNGKQTAFSNLKPGDILQGNNKIIAVLHLNGKRAPIYAYPVIEKNEKDFVFLSGTHLILENNKWIRVEDSPHAIPQPPESDLISLVTSTGFIQIKNLICSDWIESLKDEDVGYQRDRYLAFLNKKPFHSSGTTSERAWGMDPNAKVTLKNGKKKKLYNIKIGDTLQKGGIVHAIIYIDAHSCECVGSDNIWGSKDLIVKTESGKWVTLGDIADKKYMTPPCEILLHFITEEDNMEINGVTIPDYYQSHDDSINEEIDKEMQLRLNKATIELYYANC